MSEPFAEKVLPLVTLSAAERADLFNAACRAHSGPATFVCRPCADAQDAVIERVIADRLAEALAIVKRACDGECKSPGKHTGCHAHEPYRVLATTVLPPADGRPTPPTGDRP
jgi:hypothetical protein